MRQLAQKYGLEEYKTPDGKKFWYKDNGGKVLIVAHGDTVQDPGVFQPVRFKNDTWIFSPTHDDRIGLYVALCYLPKAKVKVDILITDEEEVGRSTGLYFAPPKQYNWMFMFDRKGTGAVLYQYDSEALRYRLGKHNFDIQWGSYSCIREMEHLGCAGINFGAGYQNNHTEQAYISVNDLRRQLRKFIEFFKEYQFVSMKHEIGYRRFAQAVNYNSWSYKKDIERPTLGPHKKSEDQYGDAEIIQFTEVKEEIVKADEFDWPYNNYDEYIADNKSVATVTHEGKLVMNPDRFIQKLYEPIEILPLRMDKINILRNRYGCKMIYDFVQLSAVRLVVDGSLTASETDPLVRDMQKLGFNMPYNVAGLKNVEQYEKAYECGWKKRELILRSSQANKPKTADQLKKFVSEKAEKFSAKQKAIDVGKFIELYPLPTTPEKEAEMLNTTANLVDSGYFVEAHYICTNCKSDKIFDVKLTDRLPKLCGNCLTAGESSASLPKDNQIPLRFFEASEEAGEEVFTKIQLRKKENDDTEFTFIGKQEGRGANKYAWSKPGEQAPEAKPPVGFTHSGD